METGPPGRERSLLLTSVLLNNGNIKPALSGLVFLFFISCFRSVCRTLRFPKLLCRRTGRTSSPVPRELSVFPVPSRVPTSLPERAAEPVFQEFPVLSAVQLRARIPERELREQAPGQAGVQVLPELEARVRAAEPALPVAAVPEPVRDPGCKD